jgi:tetratricopeptide (TPR) repeat protein
MFSLQPELLDKRRFSYAHSYLGDVARAEGDLAEARIEYQEALRLDQETGNKGDAAEITVALTDLSVEEGRPGDAEASIRHALAEFEAEKLADDRIWAQVVLTQALLSQGQTAEAQNEVGHVKVIAGKSQNRDVRLLTAITAGRVNTALGKYGSAKSNLQAVFAEAAKYGFVGRQFEARLGIGECEMKSGHVAAGRARLVSLEKDATSKGFLLIAHKAHAAASAS